MDRGSAWPLYDQATVNDGSAAQPASGMRDSPFVPGQGLIPPCLAGREWEQVLIQNHLARLARKRPLGTNLILYGPRGNGKTTPLVWAVVQAQTRGIRAIRLAASLSFTKEALLDELALLPAWLGRRVRRIGASPPMGASVQSRHPGFGTLGSMLKRRARWEPLLLALDEAHMIDKVFGRDLLNIVQVRQGEELPVILLFAGTPQLPRHLNAIQASFWDRSENCRLDALAQKPQRTPSGSRSRRATGPSRPTSWRKRFGRARAILTSCSCGGGHCGTGAPTLPNRSPSRT